jgi:hypothetical protein
VKVLLVVRQQISLAVAVAVQARLGILIKTVLAETVHQTPYQVRLLLILVVAVAVQAALLFQVLVVMGVAATVANQLAQQATPLRVRTVWVVAVAVVNHHRVLVPQAATVSSS